MLTEAVQESASRRAVTAQDRYLFDLRGYLVVPDAIPAGLLAQLEALYEERVDADVPAHAHTHRWLGVMDWGPAMRELIDLPSILPLVETFIGGAVRLDHDYADMIRKGEGPIGASLHGGNTPFDMCCSYQYRAGTFRSGLLGVVYNLRPVGAHGGFGCVPGSHKANEPLPPGWHHLANAAECVVAPEAPAGSAIIFTEGLAHGTMPWRADFERRTLFLKYSPACMSWAARYYDAQRWPELTQRQRALLEAPNARYGGRRS